MVTLVTVATRSGVESHMVELGRPVWVLLIWRNVHLYSTVILRQTIHSINFTLVTSFGVVIRSGVESCLVELVCLVPASC